MLKLPFSLPWIIYEETDSSGVNSITTKTILDCSNCSFLPSIRQNSAREMSEKSRRTDKSKYFMLHDAWNFFRSLLHAFWNYNLVCRFINLDMLWCSGWILKIFMLFSSSFILFCEKCSQKTLQSFSRFELMKYFLSSKQTREFEIRKAQEIFTWNDKQIKVVEILVSTV